MSIEKSICVFCQDECQPAPTERGWTSINYNTGLHFDCAQKVVDNGKRINGQAFGEAEGMREALEKIKARRDVVIKRFNYELPERTKIGYDAMMLVFGNCIKIIESYLPIPALAAAPKEGEGAK